MKTILLAGGAGSLGQKMIEEIQLRGDVPIVLDNSAASLSLLKKSNPSVEAWQVDLMDEDQVSKVCEDVFGKHKISALVNLTGAIHSEPFFSLTGKPHSLVNWNRILESNLHAVFLITRSTVGFWIKHRTKGVVINVGSVSGSGNAGQIAYATAKSGLTGFTRTLAKELGVFGIRANLLNPGFLESTSTHESVAPAIVENIKKQTALRKFGAPANLADAIYFTIGNDFLTGATIDLNGGLFW